MKTKAILTAAVVFLTIAPMSGAELVETSGSALDSGCTANTGNAQTITESPWRLGYATAASGELAPEAVKTYNIAFTSNNIQRIPLPSRGEDDAPSEVEIADCSGGTCTVEIHVYSEETVSTQTGAGFLAFLPFFFAVGGWTTVETKVTVTEESKIACEGAMWTSLKFSGGVGPQVAAASAQKTNADQIHDTCKYDNIIQGSCSTLFKGPFEVSANHAGRYTRFDVLNGGRFSQDIAVNAAGVVASVSCSPKVTYYDEVHGVERTLVDSQCIGSAGEWTAVFAAVELDVDTTEATKLLLDAAPPIL